MRVRLAAMSDDGSMTRAEEITAVMEPGRRYTTAELAEASGLSKHHAEYAARTAFAAGLIERTELVTSSRSAVHRLWIRS